MTTNIGRALAAGLLLAAFGAQTARAETPTLDEVYQMVLELRKDQERLRQEAADAKSEARTARAEAADARAEATLAKQELGRAEAELVAARADVSALPDVAASAAEPDLPAGTGAFGSVDLLYWSVDSGREVDYVLRQEAAALPDPVGDVESVEWDREEGYRIAAGYRFASGIDFTLRGLQFGSDGEDSETDPNENLSPLANYEDGDDIGTNSAGFAEGKLDVDFFQIDMELGKWFSIGGDVALRPFFAARYADFDWESEFTYCATVDCDLLDEVERAESNTDWWAAGIVGGVEGRWEFLDRFALFGRGGAGILGGQYDMSNTYRDLGPPGDDPIEFDGDEDGDTFVPVLEASVGLGVQLVESDSFGLRLEAGYEALSFLDAPIAFQGTYDDTDNMGDLSEDTVTFHGAFFRLGADF